MAEPSKRKLKKAILAEALFIFRNQNYPVRTATMDLRNGRVVHLALESPYAHLTDLMHLCAQLDGAR